MKFVAARTVCHEITEIKTDLKTNCFDKKIITHNLKAGKKIILQKPIPLTFSMCFP